MENINPHCRISSVSPKNSPHLRQIIPRVRGHEISSQMLRNFKVICDNFKKDGIAGMAIVAWGFDGSFSRATRIHKDSQIGTTLMPTVIAEILRRDIASDVARGVINNEE